MKTKGNFKEMPKYCPYVYLHKLKEHFDVIIKVKLHDSYIIESKPGQKNELIYNIIITSKKQKYRGNELLYIKGIQLPPVGVSPETNIIVTVVPPPPIGPGESPGGTTVIRYGDVPPAII